MDRAAVILVMLVSVVTSSPVDRQALDVDEVAVTTPELPTPSQVSGEAQVVVAREEEAIVEQPSLFYDEDGLIAHPGLLVGVEEDDVDVLGGELMETANSGLVFRPQFRYRKQSRRRYNRNTQRRGQAQFFAF